MTAKFVLASTCASWLLFSAHGKSRPAPRIVPNAKGAQRTHRRQDRRHERGGQNEMDPQLLPRHVAGNRRTHRQRAVEMVGEVSEVRRAERARRGRGPVSFSHFTGAGARHERRRRVRRLRQKERGKFQAAGQRLHTKRTTTIPSTFEIDRPLAKLQNSQNPRPAALAQGSRARSDHRGTNRAAHQNLWRAKSSAIFAGAKWSSSRCSTAR